jgi:hypothetical protein
MVVHACSPGTWYAKYLECKTSLWYKARLCPKQRVKYIEIENSVVTVRAGMVRKDRLKEQMVRRR